MDFSSNMGFGTKPHDDYIVMPCKKFYATIMITYKGNIIESLRIFLGHFNASFSRD